MIDNLLSIIELDLVVLVSLMAVLYLYRSRFNMKNKINNVYVMIMLVTGSIIILEVLDKVILTYHNTNLVIITKIIDILGFGLTPIVTYLWVRYLLLYFEIDSKPKFIEIPCLINIIISIFSYKFGFIFTVSKNNIYTRGPLFCLPMLITDIYFFISLFILIKNRYQTEKDEYISLLSVEIIPLIVAFMEIMFSSKILIWGVVGIIIMIHYIFLQEKLLRHDNLTKVCNRMASELYIDNNYIKKNKPFSLLYIDVNDFKFINDTYGHNEGDFALISLAKFLKQYFYDIGKVGRMGGDEFIVIVDDDKDLKDKIDRINIELEKFTRNIHKSYNIQISVGYKKFNNNYLEISDYINDVDHLMYKNNQSIKNKKNNIFE